MEQYDKDRWQELTRRIAECGVDGFECNFSCPHGHPERNMGAAMGQDPAMVEEVTGWVVEATDKPVWAKMTPNIGDICAPARAAFRGGAKGVSAINTILSCTGSTACACACVFMCVGVLRAPPCAPSHSRGIG